MKTKYITALAFFALTFCLATGNSFAKLTSGEAAPDFTLTDTSGTEHTLSSLKGKYVILEWRNPDCPFVKKHYGTGNMQTLQTKYGAEDAVWFSIASSAPGKQGNYTSEEWEGIKENEGSNETAILIDEDGTVGKLYGAKTTPHMFIIDPEGVLIYQGAIDNKPSANPEDVETAENFVDSVMQAALSGEAAPVSSTKSYGCSVKY